ncbi:hypothetical protein M569_08328 [Genlisea aurea]|uniref:P-type ATPase A domain-containing protein n=1 Tax=Genlisea aurea TaxID=192259 RepID=S8CIB3_9LAMI|nr:hypothetical protein M569_08328 [Genlisea aurea]
MYPPVNNTSKSFMNFVSESCGDSNLIILMVSAVTCSAIGIKIEGVKEGWYEGGSIVLAVVTAIIFKAVKNYQDFLQSQTSKKNLQIEVVRGGIANKISKFEIVVGDIVVLKTGEEVPADGLVVSSYSLTLEESRTNKETKIIYKDGAKDPFVMAGSKVVDGHGTMLVTSLGISAQLVTSRSKGNGEEETPPKKGRRNDAVALLGGIFGVIVSTMILIALIIRLFNRHHINNPFGSLEMITSWTKYGNVVNTFMKVFTVAVTIVAAEVPKGLALAASLIFACGKKKKKKTDSIKRVNSTRPKPKRSHVYLCIP